MTKMLTRMNNWTKEQPLAAIIVVVLLLYLAPVVPQYIRAAGYPVFTISWRHWGDKTTPPTPEPAPAPQPVATVQAAITEYYDKRPEIKKAVLELAKSGDAELLWLPYLQLYNIQKNIPAATIEEVTEWLKNNRSAETKDETEQE